MISDISNTFNGLHSSGIYPSDIYSSSKECAFGYSCEKCYPQFCGEEEENDENEENYNCEHCGAIYELDEKDKVDLWSDGMFCIDCVCESCGRKKKLNVEHNGMEMVDEEFIKVTPIKYSCKDCIEKSKKCLKNIKD